MGISPVVTAPAPLSTHPAKAPNRVPRSSAIDLVRGLVMVLMALDHTRDFFTDANFSPMDLSRATPALFLTRWVTHFCAPVFVFLAGAGAFLYGAGGRTRKQLAAFLVTRGLWLVLLEFTLVHLGWFFNLRYEILVAQVIWAIGVSMIALAGLIWLPPWAVALAGAVIVGGHNALDALVPRESSGWMVLAQLRPGPLLGNRGVPHSVFQAYPALPWLGIMALGYGFGALWHTSARRRLVTAALGAAAVALFVVLRAGGWYGDPRPWQAHDEGWATALAMLDCSKYPPSLLYALMTLGPALLLLAATDRPPGVAGGVLVTFGRVPLFFYLLHVPAIHLAALAIAAVQYPDVGFLLTHPLMGRGAFPPGYGYALPGVYLATAAVLAVLYPLCLWFGRLKRSRPSVWLSLF